MATGLSNDDIAARLILSPATAKTSRQPGDGRARGRDRARLVMIGYESGLVRIG